MDPREGLNILEALENLNAIVEVDTLDDIEVTADDKIISHKEELEEREKGEEHYWVHAAADEQTAHAVKATFRSVLHYLESFCEKMRQVGKDKELVEGVNTIMLLVGEAAKKLEGYSSLFKAHVHDFDEYKDLQNFFRKRVVQESYKEFQSLSIPVGEFVRGKEEEIYLLNDIERVKNDTDYELFQIKREDGRPFFTEELARRIKVSCDFGEFTQEYFGDDPLIQIKNFEDKSLQVFANELYAQSHQAIERFYKASKEYKQVEVVDKLHKTIMALMLAKNPRNLIRQFSLKGSYLYFENFTTFLRETIASREYQRYVLYPEKEALQKAVVNLVDQLVLGLFTIGPWQEEIEKALHDLNHREGAQEKETLASFLKERYHVLANVFKNHPNGPIFKAVDHLREEGEVFFNPLAQGNLPMPLFSIDCNGKEVSVHRMASPTHQEFIHLAMVDEIFKIYLHALGNKRILLVNMQDRTEWQEHARAEAIEELSRNAAFSENLSLITLPFSTDFYFQKGHYADVYNAQEFLNLFQEQLEDANTGFAFSNQLKGELFGEWAFSLLETVHASFFEKKKTLSQKERGIFIELTYLLIQLKALELVGADSVYYVSKDGLDLGALESVALLSLLNINSGHKLSEKELDRIVFALAGPTLIVRERAIFDHRFERLVHSVAHLEKCYQGHGMLLAPFKNLYKKETLDGGINFDQKR